MNNFFAVLIAQPFLQYALFGGILASIACGIIGPFVFVRKISYVAGGIAHTVLAGMGIAYFLGKDPMGGAFIVAIVAAFIIGYINIKAKKYEETVISILWSIGMAIGIIFLNKTPGFNIDLNNYLFGNILLISSQKLLLLLGIDGIIILLVVLFYKKFLSIVFDEEFAKIRGINVTFYYLLLLCMIALTVVSLIQIMGLILVLALLTIPSVIARQHVNSLFKIILIAIMLSIFFTSTGLVISYQFDIPTGPSIVLFSTCCLLFAMTTRALIKKFSKAL